MGNSLRHKHTKNYQNRLWFDKVIAKIKWCSFLLDSTTAGQIQSELGKINSENTQIQHIRLPLSQRETTHKHALLLLRP